MKIIAMIGFLGVAVGWALNPVIPIVMKMWTASYGLVSAGFACLMFLAFFWSWMFAVTKDQHSRSWSSA